MTSKPASEDTLTALQARVSALEQEKAALHGKLRIIDAAVERLLPCPDCRDKIEAGHCERCARQRAERRAEAAEQERDGLQAQIARLRELANTALTMATESLSPDMSRTKD